MKTITIDLLNERAVNLLRELEALNLIKLLDIKPSTEKKPAAKKRPSDYKGIISAELRDQMQEQISQSREEWQHRI